MLLIKVHRPIHIFIILSDGSYSSNKLTLLVIRVPDMHPNKCLKILPLCLYCLKNDVSDSYYRMGHSFYFQRDRNLRPVYRIGVQSLTRAYRFLFAVINESIQIFICYFGTRKPTAIGGSST